MARTVVAHLAVSLEGRTTGFEADQAAYYSLLGTWNEDVTLAGSATILAQEDALRRADLPGPDPEGPLLAVIDGRRRVTAWDELRRAGHWRDVLAVRSSSDGVESISAMNAGSRPPGRVDLRRALDRLEIEYGAAVVRVDSGGELIGALLQEGLVTDVSLLVHPVIAGTGRIWADNVRSAARLEFVNASAIGDGLWWLRYRVKSAPPA